MATRSKYPPPERYSSDQYPIMPSIEDQETIQESLAVKGSHTRQTRSTRKSKRLDKDSSPKPTASTTKPSQSQLQRKTTMKSKTKSDKKTSSRNKNALARNRIAASKCRVKKKEWTENLQLEKTGVEAIHKELHTQYITLLQEACALKNHIINHAGCCDPNIDGWISNEAAKFARRLMGENAFVASSFSLETLPTQIHQTTSSASDEVLKEMEFLGTSSEGT